MQKRYFNVNCRQYSKNSDRVGRTGSTQIPMNNKPGPGLLIDEYRTCQKMSASTIAYYVGISGLQWFTKKKSYIVQVVERVAASPEVTLTVQKHYSALSLSNWLSVSCAPATVAKTQRQVNVDVKCVKKNTASPNWHVALFASILAQGGIPRIIFLPLYSWFHKARMGRSCKHSETEAGCPWMPTNSMSFDCSLSTGNEYARLYSTVGDSMHLIESVDGLAQMLDSYWPTYVKLQKWTSKLFK